MKFQTIYSLILLLSSIFLNIQIVLSKTVMLFHDQIYSCCSGDECFDFFDISKLKVIADEEDETVAYLNGTWKMNVPVDGTVPAMVWLEKKHGSRWSMEAFNRRIDDACKNFYSETDPLYAYFKDKKGCPFEEGDELTWNMTKLVSPVEFDPSFIGEWRLIISTEKEYHGKMKKQCSYLRFDLHDG